MAIVPAILARLSPEDLRGTYQGVNHAGWGLGKVAGPALGGLVLARLGEPALWGGAAALGLGVALVVVGLRLGESRPTEPPPEAAGA